MARGVEGELEGTGELEAEPLGGAAVSNSLLVRSKGIACVIEDTPGAKSWSL